MDQRHKIFVEIRAQGLQIGGGLFEDRRNTLHLTLGRKGMLAAGYQEEQDADREVARTRVDRQALKLLDRAEHHAVARDQIYSQNETFVPRDSFFFIWPDQLLTGKKCIIIEPGGSTESVEQGSLLAGESSSMKIIFKLGPGKLEELKDAVQDYIAR